MYVQHAVVVQIILRWRGGAYGVVEHMLQEMVVVDWAGRLVMYTLKGSDGREWTYDVGVVDRGRM